MNPHFERAQILIHQGRFAMAEDELRRALINEPGNALVHATLAAALLGQDKKDAALMEAQNAIAARPNIAYCHYVHAVVLKSRERFADAETAIQQAISIEPGDPAYWGVLAGIYVVRNEWQKVLDAADAGMKLDPENEQCVNLRAMALVHLNRRDEAGATIETALGNNPHSAKTHANMGWTLLHQNQPTQAMEHFREALRIDPTEEWARAGIVEALKARNFIYRGFLAYALWLSRLKPGVRWGVVIGMVVLMQFIGRIPVNGSMVWGVLALMLAYFVFVLTVWTAEPLFNLILRFDRYGRLVLSDEQRRDSTWMGLALALILALVGTALWQVRFNDAITYLFLAIPVGVTLTVPRSQRRSLAAAVTVGLFIAASLCWYGWLGFKWPFDSQNAEETSKYLNEHPEFVTFYNRQMLYKDIVMWGCVAMSWLAGVFHYKRIR